MLHQLPWAAIVLRPVPLVGSATWWRLRRRNPMWLVPVGPPERQLAGVDGERVHDGKKAWVWERERERDLHRRLVCELTTPLPLRPVLSLRWPFSSCSFAIPWISSPLMLKCCWRREDCSGHKAEADCSWHKADCSSGPSLSYGKRVALLAICSCIIICFSLTPQPSPFTLEPRAIDYASSRRSQLTCTQPLASTQHRL